MAIHYSKQKNESQGEISIVVDVDTDNNCYIESEVFYQPSVEKIREMGGDIENINRYKKSLINFYGGYILISPMNTTSKTNFMCSKYKIQNIALYNFNYNLPETIEDVKIILNSFPEGLVKDYNYGLGIQKEYISIINVIGETDDIELLTICNCNCKTEIIGNDFRLNIKDYYAIIKGIQKINKKFQSQRQIDKEVFTHNTLLHNANPSFYPKKYSPYKKDTLVEFVSNNHLQSINLSDSDQKEIVNLAIKNTKSIVKNNSVSLIKLRNEIELVTLESLILHFEQLLVKKSKEGDWQKLFNINPFILSLAFPYPIIKFGEQICVGGRDYSGKGDKFTDFLVKNNLTDNTALIEIKTPDTQLLNRTAYRGSVYSPTPDLSGSINQILDQKYKFQQEINQLKSNARKYDLESYSINCLLIIGEMPKEPDQKKSFDLFRGNSKDVEIITFDELLEKLKQLHSFLSSDSKPSLPINESPVVSEDEKPTIIQTLPEYDDFDEDVPF